MNTWPSFGSVVLLTTAAGFFALMSAYVVLLPPPAPVLYMDTPVAVPSNTHPQEQTHD